MKKLITFAPALMALALMGAHVPAASAKDRTGSEISYADRTDISELMFRYAHYIDARPILGDAWASLFTPDGTFEFGGRRYAGKDALAAWADQLRPDTGKAVAHFIGDTLLVQVSADEIHARSKVSVSLTDASVQPLSPTQAPGVLLGTGIYEDVIVRTPTGWKFKSRKGATLIPVAAEFMR